MSMRAKKVNIAGINIANSDIDVPDGSCQEVINMRYKDGSWRPSGGVDSDWTLENTDLILHKHPVLDNNVFICYDPASDKVQMVNVDNIPHNYKDIIILNGTETFKYINHQNNFLFVVTDENIYKFIYDTTYDDNIAGTNYRQLPEIPMPEMYFDIERDTSYNVESDAGFDGVIGELYEKINERKSKGFILGQVLFRIAYKLYDGTFIKHSLPGYLNINYEKPIYYVKNIVTNTRYIKDIVLGKPRFSYLFRTTDMIDDIKKYKGIIQSVSLFMTKPMLTYDFENADGYTFYDGIGDEQFYRITVNNEIKKLFEQSNYYLIHEIDLDKLTEMVSEIVVTETIEDIDSDTIVSNELLSVDSFTHNDIWGNSIYNFNSRLHFGDTTTKIFDGYNNIFNRVNIPTTFLDHYYSDESLAQIKGELASIYFVVYIKTEEGEKIVIKEIDSGNYWVYPLEIEDPQMLFNFILAYPDTRAYKIKIIIKYNSESIYRLIDEFELKPHKLLNFAYHVIHSSQPPYYSKYTNEYRLIEFYDYEYGVYPVTTLATVSKYIYDTNRIQLSGIDNPFIYPAKNSYRIENSDNVIRIMSSITRVISEGQYGIFPLYVFTSKGIWFMEQGEGEIVYKAKNPFSREVVYNNISYVQVEGGIIFVAANSVMFISGNTIKNISEVIEGIPASYLVGYSAYDDKINDSSLVELSTVISTSSFNSYIGSAIFCYNAYEKELIVSNPTKTYSYVYAFKTEVWSKTDKVYSQFVNVDPSVYAIDTDGKGYDLYDALTFDEYQHCLLQTRPIKLDTEGYKKIERIYTEIKATIKANTKLGFYVYGSRDYYEWKFLRGIQSPKVKQSSETNISNLILGRIHTSIRWVVILITLQTKNAEIKALNFQIEDVHNKKLR